MWGYFKEDYLSYAQTHHIRIFRILITSRVIRHHQHLLHPAQCNKSFICHHPQVFTVLIGHSQIELHSGRAEVVGWFQTFI